MSIRTILALIPVCGLAIACGGEATPDAKAPEGAAASEESKPAEGDAAKTDEAKPADAPAEGADKPAEGGGEKPKE